MMQLRVLAASAVALSLCHTAHADTIVYPNIPSGDAYTNAGAANQGQAVGATGWYYNNVRFSGSVGIDGTNPRSGNGSVHFSGPNTDTYKADIEYLANAVNFGGNFVANGSLGLLSNLQDFSYEWFRASASANPDSQHPSLRVLLDRDGNLSTTGDRGGLVYEGVYNNVPVAPEGAWTPVTVTSSTYLWNFGLGLGSGYNINATSYAYDATFAEWKAFLPNAVVIGFSSGIGSGWSGAFSGNVDNIGWSFLTGGAPVTTTTNFETANVPEPATMILLGAGLLGLLRRRNRH